MLLMLPPVEAIWCCFVTFYTRKAALKAQDALHNIKTLVGFCVGVPVLSTRPDVVPECSTSSSTC
uniref:Uncharacterized protein n=1 Tax=Anopheles dirus TaxID=7168 RepID=A0A182NEI7_9DIPT